MRFIMKTLFILVLISFIVTCTSNQPIQAIEPVEVVEQTTEYFLNSSEYKLLLNPEMFGDYQQGFAQYWDIIKTVAAEQGIEILEKEEPLKLSHKEISFFDTENLDLRKQSFLLRQKVKYSGDHKQPGFEYGLKYRQANPEKTLSLDLAMAEGYVPKYDKIELESDIVYYSVKNDSLDITYAVSNSIQLEEQPIMTLAEFIKIYPLLGDLGIDPQTELSIVAGIAPDEWMVKPGKLDFGGGLYGRMDMTVWFLETEAGIISIPEFSFDHDFNHNAEWDEVAMLKCTEFINELYKTNPNWVVPGALKAAYIFEM